MRIGESELRGRDNRLKEEDDAGRRIGSRRIGQASLRGEKERRLGIQKVEMMVIVRVMGPVEAMYVMHCAGYGYGRFHMGIPGEPRFSPVMGMDHFEVENPMVFNGLDPMIMIGKSQYQLRSQAFQEKRKGESQEQCPCHTFPDLVTESHAQSWLMADYSSFCAKTSQSLGWRP
jgi:hypothetical protein